MGIEPTAQAWEAWVLPLYDARLQGILVALLWIRQMRCHRVGGELTLTALPHHRTCGSASGGST